MEKKLYRIKEGEKLCGVCTGFAAFFNIDVTIIRLIWVLLALGCGTGVVAYIACALVIPEKPDNIIDVE